jgi:hypothetical protein
MVVKFEVEAVVDDLPGCGVARPTTCAHALQAGPARNMPLGPGLGRRCSPWASTARHGGE